MVEAVSQINDGIPVARQVVKLVNGKADVTFPYQPEFRRIVSFLAWNPDLTESNFESALASRAVIFPDVSDLHITAAPGQPTYKPGEKASIEMHAESVDGHPVEAAFGIALVDQAVLERAETDNQFGQRRWFACMFCGDAGEQEVGGVRLNDLYSLKQATPIPPGMDLTAELLAANSNPTILTNESVSLRDQPFHEVQTTVNSWTKPLEDYFNLTFRYPANAETLEKVLGKKWTDLRDPWGMHYSATFEIRNRYNVINLKCAGPDKKFGTTDDYRAATISHPWFDRTRAILEQSLKEQTDYPATETELKAILNTEGIGARVLRDPWGTAYSFRIMTEANMRHITVMSAGPDRTFGTVDDLSPGALTGRYFQREESEMRGALGAAPEMPHTVEAFRAALEKAGIDPARYRDAWGRPYRLASIVSSRYADRRDESVTRVFGQQEALRVTMTPVTQHLITLSLRSAGPDGMENTWDDFDIASFPVVLSEDAGNEPPVKIARDAAPLKGTGVVYGMVKDPADAVVPNATVTLIDANSMGHETHTDLNGEYQFVSVPAGAYTLKAHAPGFRSYVVSRIPVTADKTVSVDVLLQLGAVSESIEVRAGVALLQTSSAEVTSSHLATPRVRDYFPETLLWLPEIDSDKLGNARTQFTMADSVTNWKLAVIASTLDGRVAETESSIHSFQPFFLSFNPPPVLTAGDRLDLPVTVRNYTKRARKATIQLEPNNWSSVHDGASKKISIPANDSANTTFAITAEKPAVAGTARIIAGSGANRDAIEKTLKVHPDGREITQIAGDLITAKTSLKVTIPSTAIDGANHGEIHLYPNLASMLFESASAVLETPHGCAEQTISAGYANLVALRYARAAGLSSASLEERARKNVDIALSNLPAFEHASGGISYWTTTDPDIAVTAYAINFLVEASAVLSVDPDDIEPLASWLEKEQGSDGTWSAQKNTRHESEQQKLLLTSLAIRSLAAAQKSGTEVPAKTFATAYHHLALFTDQLDEPYLLSQFILAALDSGDEKLLGNAVTRLVAMAHSERDGLYWDLKTNSPFYGWGTAGRYETTGLAISALTAWKARHTDAAEADAAARKGVLFLLRGRDRAGSWESTQSTVRAMKAIGDAAPGLGKLGGSGGSIRILANGTPVRTVEMPAAGKSADPIIVDVSPFLRTGDNNLELLPSAGTQSALMHLTSSYWTPWDQKPPEKPGELALSVKYDHLQAAVGDTIHCAVKAERVGFRGYGMMLAEVGLPPATEVDRSSLEAAMTSHANGLGRYDVLPDRLILYLWPIAGGSTVDFTVRPRTSMVVKTAQSTLYDYYNPEARAEVVPAQLTVR
jgi:hypothetical protein